MKLPFHFCSLMIFPPRPNFSCFLLTIRHSLHLAFHLSFSLSLYLLLALLSRRLSLPSLRHTLCSLSPLSPLLPLLPSSPSLLSGEPNGRHGQRPLRTGNSVWGGVERERAVTQAALVSRPSPPGAGLRAPRAPGAVISDVRMCFPSDFIHSCFHSPRRAEDPITKQRSQPSCINSAFQARRLSWLQCLGGFEKMT